MPSSEVPKGGLPARTRRPHQKSRTGCLNCRDRRVKCGEQRPRCQSCVRRDESCQYPAGSKLIRPTNCVNSRAPASPDAADNPSEPESLTRTRASNDLGVVEGERDQTGHTLAIPPTPSSTSGASHAHGQPLPNFSIRDLALLHHWTVSTSSTIFNTPNIDILWQVTFPQVGFEHHFVVHAILALTALHLAYMNNKQDSPHVLEATMHHEKSLTGFHDVVEHFTRDKCEAVFSWSILNILYTFAISKQLAGPAERAQRYSHKDRLLGVEWIPMVRGVDAVLAPHYDSLRNGRMKPVIDLGNWAELNPTSAIADPMDEDLRRVRGVWKDSSHGEVYEEALHILRKCRMYIVQFHTMDPHTLQQWGSNRAWAGPLAFIHFAPEQYFTLLHQRQAPALVLFAYFGAFFHMLDEHWFLQGWGREIVEVVDDILGSYWKPWILPATAVVGLD
ncbi:hypothetical protein GQ53DRAFT_684459 [Thozetella sp. PMI_491]|nr:hypothetical protein GQ53DRAFT_684459 [Thozetella sp. PMI_491]